MPVGRLLPRTIATACPQWVKAAPQTLTESYTATELGAPRFGYCAVRSWVNWTAWAVFDDVAGGKRGPGQKSERGCPSLAEHCDRADRGDASRQRARRIFRQNANPNGMGERLGKHAMDGPRRQVPRVQNPRVFAATSWAYRRSCKVVNGQ
jgi:hypothetical protein